MAAVAAVESVARIFGEYAKSAPGSQVWLDLEHGLVAGNYPKPANQFDFVRESFIACGNNQAKGAVVEKPRISKLGTAKRVGQLYELETQDSVVILGSATQALAESLDLIEEKCPGTLEQLSKQKKNSKRPVSRAREDLYDTPHPPSHSTLLRSGYYLATNNKAYEALGIIRSAIRIAGLEGTLEIRRA